MNGSLPATNPTASLVVAVLLGTLTSTLNGAAATADAIAPFVPPALPNGQTSVRDQTNAFLRSTPTLRPDVAIAKTAPVITMMFYPGQTYAGNPWSCWGDGVAVAGKYYSAIGDHLAPDGNAFVFEYDDATRALRRVVDARETLALPEGHYTPGKIHSRVDQGADGWLYFATHRGSTRVTTDEFHYRGDWILRHHPERKTTEIIAGTPIPKHSIPASVLDP